MKKAQVSIIFSNGADPEKLIEEIAYQYDRARRAEYPVSITVLKENDPRPSTTRRPLLRLDVQPRRS